MRVSVAIACLITLGCARETSERPIAASPAKTSASSSHPSLPSLPWPETAFTGGEPPLEERYTTRSIGPRSDERAPSYRGARIDLDVKGADIHDVFRLIADVGKVNVVVAGEVSGTITLKLTRVPWDQALDVVAKAKGLALERDGNVIIVHAH